VPVLNAADPVPGCPRRILVAGTSGSGKTTLAARVGQVLQHRSFRDRIAAYLDGRDRG